jgi:2-polyprenyl-3-methyl-5-hydroxy-6-metoxy-1,4-benzoquinol methylase
MKEKCRFCSNSIHITFCDLGKTPPSNSYLKSPDQKEHFFPLHAFVCDRCYLVQLGQFQTPDEIFSDYAYFSSYSSSWVEHARQYVEMMTHRFSLDSKSFVVEIASNDGYLLQHFKAKNIPVLGIEPAKNVAAHAEKKGIPSLVKFFGLKTAQELTAANKKADVLLGNNVLAHVPDLNDFVAGLKELLAPNGVITLEFPHLLQLIIHNQFDTIYHEHFSYFSLYCLEKVFEKHALHLFDVDEIPTHGGSLRVFLQHKESKRPQEVRVDLLRKKEEEQGLHKITTYSAYAQKVAHLKKDLIAFFDKVKKEGKKIAGYGAPAKGNTLLNFCGITTKHLPFTVDLSPHKQGHYLPGTKIPIFHPEKLAQEKPDYILILPWNLKDEIKNQMAFAKDWGAKFVIPIPQITLET